MNPDDRERAKTQTAEIIALLERGPATNAELVKIAFKYTSRISDARKLGHVIKCRRLTGGLTEYRLERPKAAQGEQLGFFTHKERS